MLEKYVGHISIYVKYKEDFDDFTAIINSDKQNYRLTIFRNINDQTYIVYQADCFTKNKLKKLKHKIFEFRYALTNREYEIIE